QEHGAVHRHETEREWPASPDRIGTSYPRTRRFAEGSQRSRARASWCGIMVWIILEQLDRGMTWDEIVREWPGKVPKAGISEAIAISDLVVKHEPFKGPVRGGLFIASHDRTHYFCFSAARRDG